jgi:hypothetical protein
MLLGCGGEEWQQSKAVEIQSGACHMSCGVSMGLLQVVMNAAAAVSTLPKGLLIVLQLPNTLASLASGC